MSLDRRIRRRQRGGYRLIRSYDALSPVAHADEPSNRGRLVERLLDHLDPVFEGRLPPNGYLWGPQGAGKSAVVERLFAGLQTLTEETHPVFHTSTRAATRRSLRFLTVDALNVASEFAFYRSVLDGLVAERVPEHGISTGDLQARLDEELSGSNVGAVIAIDHVDDPNAFADTRLTTLLAGLPSNVSWLAVGRGEPTTVGVTEYTADEIRVQPYAPQTLADLVLNRTERGVADGAVGYDTARRIADWADGNAYDALCALFVACERANAAARTTVTDADVTAGIEEVPPAGVSLGRVCALPANRRHVVYELTGLDPEDRRSVNATAETIAARDSVDLSTSTVERFLYELAEVDVLRRVRADTDGTGRPPSRVEPRFPPTVFRRLYEL